MSVRARFGYEANTYASATGRLVKNPKMKLASPAMAAVAVIRSSRTSGKVSRAHYVISADLLSLQAL